MTQSLVYTLANCLMICEILIKPLRHYYTEVQFWFEIKLLCLALAESLRQSGHWWFCFEYLELAVTASTVFIEKKRKQARKMKIAFWAVTVVQASLPLAGYYLFYIAVTTPEEQITRQLSYFHAAYSMLVIADVGQLL